MAHLRPFSSPVTTNHDVLEIRELPADGVDPSPLAGRIAYAFVSLFALAIVSGCFSLHVHNLTPRQVIRLPLIRIYLLAVYFWGICFIISTAVVRSGFQVTNDSLCLASILLCLVFYVVDKVLMYLFLVERVYVVRRRRHSRRGDRLYLVNLAIVILGFGCIAVFSFIFPVAERSLTDRKCRIGLPFKITLPLLIYDVMINVYLTAHFVYFARPQMMKWSPKALFRPDNRVRVDPGSSSGRPSTGTRRRDTTLRRLAERTLKGMCVMLLATIINLAILFHMRGREQYWMCFMFCTMDVAVGIVTLHWITSDPSEMDLGRSQGEKQSQSKRYSHVSRLSQVAADSASLAEVTSQTTFDTRAWADDRGIVTVPNKILVTTSYSCHDDIEDPQYKSQKSQADIPNDDDLPLTQEDKYDIEAPAK